MILKLLKQNPGFQKIYEEVYGLCLNSERMVGMFSKELEILDRNTVKLMIDELAEEFVNSQKSFPRSFRFFVKSISKNFKCL